MGKVIDMEEVICEGTKKDDSLGKHLRTLEKRQVRIYGKLVIALLQNRLMNYDCLNEGWILVRFPRDRADFEALDSFDTPPNRIIFLIPTDLDKRDCLREWVALNPRNYAQEIKDALCIEKKAAPSLCSKPIRKESLEKIAHPFTVKQLKDFLDYCGRHSKFVNPELPLENIIEVISKYVTDSPPCAPPRSPTKKDELTEQLIRGPLIEEPEECCYPDERLKKKSPEIEVIKELEESSFESVMEQFSDTTTTVAQVKSSSVICDDKSCLDIFPWKNEYQGCGKRAEKKDPFEDKKQAPSCSEFDLESSSSFR